MRASAFDPPEVPPEFWGRDDVREALLSQDMGLLFRLLARHAGLSQTRIGTASGLSQGRVSEIVRGTRKIASARVLARIADGLRMPPAARSDLGLAPAPLPHQAASEDDLRDRLAAARGIDQAAVAALRAGTDRLRMRDRTAGARTVAAELDAHIARIEAGFRYSLTPAIREQLAAALADASALAGWQAIDTGLLHRAWEHFGRATEAALASADACLLAFASAEQGYVLLDLHRPDDALAMVRESSRRARSGVPAQMRAWLHAAEAEMAVAAGYPAACLRSFDAAASFHAASPGGAGLPYLALDSGHLARWRGNCLVAAGDPQAAADLDVALETMDVTFTRARASLHCDLAAARHASGDLDEAARHLQQALSLASATGSARQARRISELRARIVPGG